MKFVNYSAESWRTLFSPQGRTGRLRYWLVLALVWSVLLASAFLTGFAGEASLIFLAPVLIALIPITLFNAVKRMHDLGRTGWWIIVIGLLLTPLQLIGAGEPAGSGAAAVGSLLRLIASLVYATTLGVLPGQRGANRFGDPPGLRPPADEPA